MEELPKTGLGEKGQLVATLIGLLTVGFSVSLLFASASDGSYGLVAAAAVAAVAIAFAVLSASRTLDRFQRRLERSASYDQLTGAFNCMAFSVLCDHAVKEARRNGTPLSVAMFDIDDFAEVVERQGRQASDKALKLVAAGGQSGLRQATRCAAGAATSSSRCSSPATRPARSWPPISSGPPPSGCVPPKAACRSP